MIAQVIATFCSGSGISALYLRYIGNYTNYGGNWGLALAITAISFVPVRMTEKARKMKDYNVQCLSGHIHTVSREELISLSSEETVRAIDNGELLSAPIISASECYDCTLERERVNRLNSLMLDPVY